MNALYIFDFDDTLAMTDSHVRVIRSNGVIDRLDSREFAAYRQAPGDTLDFSEFNRASGSLIDSTVKAMEDAILEHGISNVYIVTARAIGEPVTQFLASLGVSTPEVVATAGSEGKARWLTRKLITGSYKSVYVYEDCRKNITMLRDVVGAYNEDASPIEQVEYYAICILPSGKHTAVNEALLNEGFLDYVQTGLDVVGFVPGAGEIADAINTLISVGRGNPLDAFMSAISMIPLAGDAVGKTGKVILKVFNPVLDLIKAGKSNKKIIAKLGPDVVKKIMPVVKTFQEAILKFKEPLKELLEAIMSGDIKKFEKVTEIEIPSLARGKFESMLKEAGDKIKEANLGDVIEFFSEFGQDDDEEEVDDTEDATDDNEEETDLEEQMIHRMSLIENIYVSVSVQDELKILAENIRKITNKSVYDDS